MAAAEGCVDEASEEASGAGAPSAPTRPTTIFTSVSFADDGELGDSGWGGAREDTLSCAAVGFSTSFGSTQDIL